MTNIEFVCQSLRCIGRADAAQVLESYSDADWHRYTTDSDYPQRTVSLGSAAHRVLDDMMPWSRTPQGAHFWRKSFLALQREGIRHD